MADSFQIKQDFPAWLSPTIVKELRQGLRTPMFAILFTGIPFLLAALFAISTITGNGGDSFIHAPLTKGIFWTIVILTLLVIIPFRALNSVSSEISTKNTDLLVLTRLSPFRIILGKWSSLFLQSLLIAFTFLPFLFFLYWFGGIDLLQELAILFTLLIKSSILIAAFLWFSGMPSILRILLVVLIMLFGSNIAGMIFSMYMVMQMGMSPASSGPAFSMGLPVLAAMAAGLYHAFFVSAAFLLLASRRISPPSDNISKYLRLIVLALLAAIPVTLLVAPNESAFSLPIFASICVITVILVADLCAPSKLMPAHFKQFNQGIWKYLPKLFFLPGFFSSSAFLAMCCLASILAINILYYCGSCFEGASQPLPKGVLPGNIVLSWAVLLYGFSLHAPALIIKVASKGFKQSSWFLHMATAIPFTIFGSIFHAANVPALTLLLPWMAISFPFAGDLDKSGQLIFSVLLTVVVMGAGLVAIFNDKSEWDKAKSLAKKSGSQSDE